MKNDDNADQKLENDMSDLICAIKQKVGDIVESGLGCSGRQDLAKYILNQITRMGL